MMILHFSPRKSLYLIIIIGFSISLGGWIIYQGGMFHIILGGAIALGAVVALMGVVVDLYRQGRKMRQ